MKKGLALLSVVIFAASAIPASAACTITKYGDIYLIKGGKDGAYASNIPRKVLAYYIENCMD